MSDKEPSAEAKEQAKEIVYYWRDQIAAGYEIHRDVLDDLAIDIAAALDAKDQEIARWKDLREQDQRSARYAIDERDALKLKLALTEAHWKEDMEQSRALETQLKAELAAKNGEIERLNREHAINGQCLMEERDALAQQLEEAVRLVAKCEPRLQFCSDERPLEVHEFLSRPDIAKILEKQKGGAA